mgnify:CR=1 FL=1
MSQSKKPSVAGNRSGSSYSNYSRGRSHKPKPGLQKHQYHIEHMDALGQGVCKQNGAITFIAKTLPGESGMARIHKRSKGVQFATGESIAEQSEQRIKPECVHFQQCPGCHYLHTDYPTELGFKQPYIGCPTRNMDSKDIEHTLTRLIIQIRGVTHYNWSIWYK